jgi:hypothetical protein
VIKVFFHSKLNSDYLKDWLKLNPINWLQIYPDGKVKSDIISKFKLKRNKKKTSTKTSTVVDKWHEYLIKAKKLERSILFGHQHEQSTSKLEEDLRSYYRFMYQTPEGKLHKDDPLFNLFSKEHKRMLFKELELHWSWISQKQNNPDAFGEAVSWFKERGSEWLKKGPITIHDVSIYFHQLHRKYRL